MTGDQVPQHLIDAIDQAEYDALDDIIEDNSARFAERMPSLDDAPLYTIVEEDEDDPS